MAAVWSRGPLSFADLVDEVKRRSDWGDATIKTLLHRLMQKGAVKSIKADGRLRYHAMLTREAFVAEEVGALVERLFAGDPQALRAYLDPSRTTPP